MFSIEKNGSTWIFIVLSILLSFRPLSISLFSSVQPLDYTSLAEQAGFVKIACLKPPRLADGYLSSHLDNWLRSNAGALSYIDSKRDILVAPFTQRPWAKSLIIASFLPERDDSPLFQLPPAHDGRPFAEIAPYALDKDYHVTGREKLKRLEELLFQQFGPAQTELGVDSEPVLEKPLAQIAGIGSRALNSLIYDDCHACSINLAILFTAHDLPPRLLDAPKECPHCGKCLQSCPTKAFGGAEGFQVRRCRAWLSSEYRKPLSWEEQILLGPTLYGCGKCTSSCPKTNYAKTLAVDAEDFLRMPSAAVTRLIKGTALDHTGTTVLKRNAAAAIGQQLPPDIRQARKQELLALCASPTVIQTIDIWP
jgi:epoxyqueuosine reductase